MIDWIVESEINIAWLFRFEKFCNSACIPSLTVLQKAEYARIWQQTLDCLNAGGHQIISAIVIGDKAYMPFLDVC